MGASGALGGMGTGAGIGAAVGSAIPGVGTAIGAGVGAVAGLIAGLFQNGQDEAAMQVRQQAAAAWNIPLPQFDRLMPQEVQQSFADPQMKQAQLSALGQLQNLSQNGGMDAQAQAQNIQAQNLAEQQLRSQNSAIMANRQARGLGGSGDELAGLLAGSQGANQNYALSSANAAAAARQRALQALSQGAQLAGGIRGQDLAQSGAEAALGRFNAGMRTAALQYNNGMRQTGFEDQARRAAGYSNALQGVADQHVSNGRDQANTIAGIGQGAAGVGASLGQYYGGDMWGTPDTENDGQDYADGMMNQGPNQGVAGYAPKP